jgi:hypothetical protein
MKKAIAVLAAVLSVGFLDATAAHYLFDECGTLEQGVEGGCVYLRPDYYPSERLQLMCDPGELWCEDYVRVRGLYSPMCPAGYCMEQCDGAIFFCTVLPCGPCCIDITGNVDNDWEEHVDLADLTKLIDYLFISFTAPECLEEANIDGDPAGIVDLGDLTSLIDYLFISFTPPAECQ